MTRKLLLATTAIACLALIGCGQKTASNTTPSDSASTTTTTTTDTASNAPTPSGPTGAGDLGATSAPPPTGAASPDSSTADTAAQSNTAPGAASGSDAAAEAPTSPATGVDEASLAAPTTAQGFVSRAGMSDQFEIQSSKLALARPVSPDLKGFAQMMIDAHTATTTKVKDIASKDALTLPTGLTADQQSTLDKLRAASDTEFPAMYVAAQVKGHQAALKLMNDFSASGDNADLKQFAAATAPAVQEHLTKAQALGKATGPANPS